MSGKPQAAGKVNASTSFDSNQPNGYYNKLCKRRLSQQSASYRLRDTGFFFSSLRLFVFAGSRMAL